MIAALDLREEEEDANVGAADSREEKSAVVVVEDARVWWMSRKGLGAKA